MIIIFLSIRISLLYNGIKDESGFSNFIALNMFSLRFLNQKTSVLRDFRFNLVS